jgi:two-component system, response regulator PdtaR
MKKTIIVVDDEPISRMDICEILTEYGYEVVGQASNGFEAVDLCRKFKPNLAIMDIKMPLFDGLKASKIITSENLADSVVLLTAYSGSEFIEEAKDAGVSGYIVKPIDEKSLIPEVEIAISRGEEMKKLKAEMNKVRIEIEKRKDIDSAKKVIIKKLNVSEDDAYKWLRKESMDSRLSIHQLAISIIEKTYNW